MVPCALFTCARKPQLLLHGRRGFHHKGLLSKADVNVHGCYSWYFGLFRPRTLVKARTPGDNPSAGKLSGKLRSPDYVALHN
jgi:hypothetical protein